VRHIKNKRGFGVKIKLTSLIVLLFSANTFAQSNLDYSGNCGEGVNYTFSFVGDLIMHSPLQRKAARNDDFKTLWPEVIPYFQLADFSYANLETPLAQGISLDNKDVGDPGHKYEKNVYTTYPRFNTHFSLADDLIESGIDVVSTSNNHSLDRGAIGADRTVDNLVKSGLKFTGTRKSGETENDRPWYTITDNKGLSVAWLACTESTNGIRDRKKQVLMCHQDKQIILDLITMLDQSVDVVVMLPHWGKEKHERPTKQQVNAGHLWLEQGADMVVGSHPHVLQPMEKYTTSDGRDGLILYSMGNFTTFHYDVEQKSTVVLYVNIEKIADNSIKINGVKFLPLFMRNRTGDLMDVEVHPHLPDNNFRGSGFSDLDKSIDHIFEMYDPINAILEPASKNIEFSHCDRRTI